MKILTVSNKNDFVATVFRRSSYKVSSASLGHVLTYRVGMKWNVNVVVTKRSV